MKSLARPLKALLLACACILATSAGASTQAPATASHTSDLAGARVDRLDNGTVVVSMDAKGELAGALTLTLTPNGDGSYAGQWAFMVGHTDNTDPETGLDTVEAEVANQSEDPEHEGGEHHPHRDYVTYVHRGAINGDVTHATLSFGPDGLGDLSATITITQGALEFNGATGTGIATLSSLILNF